MSLQAYLDNIKAKTGKTPEDFRRLAEKKGLVGPAMKSGPIVAWLKRDFGLERGHAMAIVLTLKSATQPQLTKDENIAKLFTGEKGKWRKTYDHLLSKVNAFGPGVSVAPTSSYVSILRKGKKFAIVQITTDRLDIGLKLKGEEATARFENAGSWNSMVTHRVRITEPRQIDNHVLTRLHRAYDRSLE